MYNFILRWAQVGTLPIAYKRLSRCSLGMRHVHTGPFKFVKRLINELGRNFIIITYVEKSGIVFSRTSKLTMCISH